MSPKKIKYAQYFHIAKTPVSPHRENSLLSSIVRRATNLAATLVLLTLMPKPLRHLGTVNSKFQDKLEI